MLTPHPGHLTDRQHELVDLIEAFGPAEPPTSGASALAGLARAMLDRPAGTREWDNWEPEEWQGRGAAFALDRAASLVETGGPAERALRKAEACACKVGRLRRQGLDAWDALKEAREAVEDAAGVLAGAAGRPEAGK